MQPRRLDGFTYAPAVNDHTQYFALLDELKKQQDIQKGQQMMAEQQKGKKGSGNQSMWSSLISETGGAGGALGGAAAGAAIGSVVPVLGTTIGGVLGAGIGGFLGGTGGRLAENQIRDNEMRAGDALKEGALSGAFGAAGQGFQAVRGLQAVGKAGGAKGIDAIGKGASALGSIEDDAARLAAEKAVTLGGKKAGIQAAKDLGMVGDDYVAQGLLGGLRNKTASRLTKGGTGLRVGNDVGDINELDQVVKVFQKHGISGTGDDQLKAIDSTMSKLGTQVDDMLAKKPVPLKNGVANRIQTLIDDPTSPIDLTTKGGREALEKHIATASKFKDARELNSLVSRLNPMARRAYNKLQMGAAPTPKEEAALAFKTAADDVLQEIAPGIRATKQEMALLFKYNPQVAKQSLKGLDVPFVGKLTHGIAQPLRSAQTRAGNLVAGTSNMGSGRIAGAMSSTPGRLAKGMAVRGIANEAMQPQSLEEALYMNSDSMANMTTPTNMTTTMPANTSTMMDSQYQTDGQMSSDSPFAVENVQANVQNMLAQGATMKDVKEYLGIVQTIAKLNPDGGKSGKLTNSAIDKISEFDNSIANLDEVEGMVDGTFNPILGRLRSLNPFDTKAANVDQATLIAAQNIGRALEGGKLTDADIARYQKALPNINDTPQVARDKIARLRFLIGNQRQNFMGLQGQYAGSGNPLEDAMYDVYGTQDDTLPY